MAGYGQVLGGPDFALPLIGHAAWWAWVVELIAWLSTFGIVGLTILRWRLTRAGRAAPPYAPDSDGGKRPRTSRFAGSTSVIATHAPSGGGLVSVSQGISTSSASRTSASWGRTNPKSKASKRL